jgi:uncharacterized membrane protein YraQ (UPF0718 family)
VIEFFQDLLIETWRIFTDAAPYVIFGFLAAGLIKAIVPEDAVARHLGGRSTTAVIKASLFGIPLPLCSCGLSWCRLRSRALIQLPSPGRCSIR